MKIACNKSERTVNMLKQKSGITLIALVVTIVVLLILSGITISMVFGQDGIITSANKAKMMTELSKYKEELEMFKLSKSLENPEFSEESITAGETSLVYNTQEQGSSGSIYDVITSLRDSSFAGKMEIIKGKLLINSQNMTEIRVAQQLGIEVNPYKIENGVLLSSNTNLALMDSSGTLTIPEGIKAIGEGAFANLSGLKTIIIPGTVKEIRKNAFSNNTELEKVILQEGVETIGDSAFRLCTQLKSIELPESLTNIGQGAFRNCRNLQEIEIPSQINVIDGYTFNACSNLTKVKLPENLTAIKTGAFSGCSKLENINISSKVNSIVSGAFDGCTNLINIEIAEENTSYKYDKNNGMLITTDGLEIVFISDAVLKNVTTFSIPEGITNFNVNLSSYKNITTIVIPKSLVSRDYANMFPETISNVQVAEGNNNFSVENNCLYNKEKTELIMCYTKEANVKLADTVTKIGNYSFKQAINIENVDFSNLVTTISSQVFTSSNTKLKNINIGASVTKIDSLFKYQNYYGTVTIDEGNQNYSIENNVLYNKDKTELVTVLYKIEGQYIIKNDITKIGDLAFHNQVEMTEVILPGGLKEISSSFNSCSGLTSIYIPNSVETIDSRAFYNSPNLDKIQIDKEAGSIEGSPWGATKGDRVIEWLR